MSTSAAVVTALTFVWLGMVFAISFLEAPLKFRAPGVTLPIGLGIGRLVFRALNAAEVVWAAAILIAVVLGSWPGVATPIAAGVAIAALVIQLVAVRPALAKRSDAVLAGYEGPRSSAHLVYVAFEVIKVAALIWLGTAVLVSAS
ncbi:MULTISPECIES: hypothetical protein [Gordonia]|jgi:hypothetical protein|uniref:DUF4149 domain-containing protein n=2 Tax=Gordonia alkanivorans TaxID=84096 RepID=F9VRB6_9ACTN|nr:MULTISPECIES: hypothetical protein [Gordonia]ETA06259.1 membrane protein [Gordonia alkanivorans CGMCC 6845]MDH3009123.1 hypothetical protein [Gordonia alkanivorans]MDH3013578.1 hypothetical protein [Gordonia alkanivorans]MDH3018035.1 hypothetical protein [Gordonia alkanivorans]MDH3022330.1 hypothetical protein [Gordonia alkanivorans]